jgi:hypothetical protein
VQIVKDYCVPIGAGLELELRCQIRKSAVQWDIVIKPESARIESTEARMRISFRQIRVREHGRPKLHSEARLRAEGILDERDDRLPGPPSAVGIRLIYHPDRSFPFRASQESEPGSRESDKLLFRFVTNREHEFVRLTILAFSGGRERERK